MALVPDARLLQVLLVDDEPLARSRLRALIEACASPAAAVTGEAGHAARAMELVHRQRFDVVMLDVRMPGADGVALARALRELPQAPRVVFVSAHADHAVQAFEVDAVDYLTKPVQPQRLQEALRKVQRLPAPREGPETLVIQERGRVLRLPLHQVIYLKAELKYVTVRTATTSYLIDAPLAELAARHAGLFLRVHRNALVALKSLRALERAVPAPGRARAEHWVVRLEGVPERLPVSRRLLGRVRDAIAS